MLAQNFKTATELNLPDWEHAALTQVLSMLERGEITHAWSSIHPSNEQSGLRLNMSTTGEEDYCGTVACIGGWARILGKKPICCADTLEKHAYRRGELYKLYFPPGPVCYRSITTEQAASALRNYLTIGKPLWDAVLAGE